jgi:hypothetical protein
MLLRLASQARACSMGMCRCASEHAHWHASGGTRPAGMQWAWMTRTLAGLEMRRPGPPSTNLKPVHKPAG